MSLCGEAMVSEGLTEEELIILWDMWLRITRCAAMTASACENPGDGQGLGL
jgi:hypothetical protein